MPENYTIYISNKSTSRTRFWCFLQKPEGLPASEAVYANSSASMTVASNNVSKNSFSIPIQYKIDAGATNQAVGLNIVVQSDTLQDVALGQVWGINYYPPTDTQGPDLALQTDTTDPDKVGIDTNSWDKAQEAPDSWYSFTTFGKETANGFIGFTWSPDPLTNMAIKPIVTFYVATGEYEKNQLADWTKVSKASAKVSNSDFSASREATVLLDSGGKWTVTPGKPSFSAYLGVSDLQINDDLLEIAALKYISATPGVRDTITSVTWVNTGLPDTLKDDEGLGTYLVGKLSVTAAVAVTFTCFVLSGIQFNIANNDRDPTSFYFSYNGTESASFIKALFKTGAQIYLGRQSA